jgi:uncharacterized protein YbjT (DUF2867 family)
MTITVIGATGRVGSAVVQRLVNAGAAVRVLVRDPEKAKRLFGDSPRLETVRAHLDDPAAVAVRLIGSDTVFLAMGSVGAVTFRAASAIELIRRLTQAGVTPGQAELLVTREWAIMAGENERTTGTVRELTGHEPRTIEEFLHENRELFR